MQQVLVNQHDLQLLISKVDQLESKVQEVSGNNRTDTITLAEAVKVMNNLICSDDMKKLFEKGVLPYGRIGEKGRYVTSRKACIEYANSLLANTLKPYEAI